ncbi:MAG: hypothetical protein E7268_03835 [Lachnospiraceae bacterium]|nr:hypothetical protein [Lachnospiraceae bacterium]
MSNLKTYAESEGLMPFGEDYFFGNLRGYSSALFVNPAGKQLTVNTCISDKEQQEKLQNFLQTSDVKAKYHINQYSIEPEKLHFQWCSFGEKYSFEDISAFISWFYPQLKEYGASGIHVCPECGKEILPLSGHWYMMAHNRTVHYIHSACRGSLMQKEQQATSCFRKNKIPTYKAGFLWALLFSLPGTILWSLLVTKSDAAPCIGIFIGVLAWLGYTLAPGRRGAATLPLLFASALLNLLAGTGIAGLVCAISGQAVDTVQLSAYTFIGFILGVVILLLLQLVAFLFRDKEMTGVIDLE